MRFSTVFIFLYCAAIAAAFRSRIANRGEKAEEREFPYQVSLRYENEHFCGGALISTNHVLTAAHCVQDNVDDDNYLLKDVSVEVGMIFRGSGKVYKVKRISYHPLFKNKQFQNDVAVVHLVEPVEISDKISIINLPKGNQNSSLLPGSRVTVSGFGSDDIDNDLSPVLKKFDAKIVSIEVCQKDHTQLLILGNICAARGKGYGSCEGDSGGPLVDETKTTLVGIVSGGKDSCQSGIPDVYTEVSRFIPYINSELSYKPENPGDAAKNPAINLDD